MHPLATDQTLPESLRKAFARVTHHVVLTYDDGSEVAINAMGIAQAESMRARELARVGIRYRNADLTGHRTCTDVVIREAF